MNDWWADVPAARALPATRRATERAMLVALVARPVRSRIARPVVLAAGGLALASATGAAFAFLGADEATDRSQAECHTTIEVARGANFAGTGVELRIPLEYDSTDRAVVIREAVESCADLWRQGVLRPGAENAQLPTGRVENVPSLTVCLTANGVAAVFPTGRDVCPSLGLQRAVE